MKKSLLCLILIFTLLSSLLCPASFAGGEETTYRDGDYEYTLVKKGDSSEEVTAKIVSIYPHTFDNPTQYLSIPESLGGYKVSHIGNSSFNYYRELREIALPASLVSIDGNPFTICKISKISLSPNNQSLAIIDGILYNKTEKSLIYCPEYAEKREVVIPQGIISIGEYAFSSCETLETISIPDSVTHISEGAFAVCKSLKNISLPNSIVYIGDKAFVRCTSLTKIAIPDSVISIGENPFLDCENLKTISIAKNNQCFSVTDGILYSNNTEKTLISCPPKIKNRNIVIPQGILTIGNYAFSYCKSLKEITIPDTITHIGNSAFSGSTLSKVTIPNSVIYIGEHAFSMCGYLNELTIPDSVTFIADNAFSMCDSLTLIVGRDSYAAEWAEENEVNYKYTDTDSLDWLNS